MKFSLFPGKSDEVDSEWKIENKINGFTEEQYKNLIVGAND